MAYNIIYKKNFYKKLAAIIEYLENEWSEKVVSDFIKKLDKRMITLREQPFIGSVSQSAKGVRGVLITKHNKLFYKISGNKIIILNLYDTRINPKKNPYL